MWAAGCSPAGSECRSAYESVRGPPWDLSKTHWLLGVGVAAGLTFGLAIGRRGRMQRMPRLDAWQRALAEQ